MRRAAQLRQQGLSLRQIGEQLAVDKRTVQRDLERWEAAEVDQLLGHVDGAYGPSGVVMPQVNAPPRKIDPMDRRMR